MHGISKQGIADLFLYCELGKPAVDVDADARVHEAYSNGSLSHLVLELNEYETLMFYSILSPMRCLDDMPIVKMGIAGRGSNIGMAKQLANHQQGFRVGSGVAGKAVPQIMEADAG
jgi:hypothetical protein